MYNRPTIKRLGTLRNLTQFGWGGQSDLLGIQLNVDVGCTQQLPGTKFGCPRGSA